MKKLILLAVCFCASTCIAQGVRYDSVALNPRGAPIPNATITLCTGTATGTPCSPAALGYTDITTSVSCASGFPVVQQIGGGCTSTTDGNGNFGFWLIPGTYKYSISGPSVATPQTYTITVPVGATAGGTPTMPSLTITGALTAGSASTSKLDNVIYVDGITIPTVQAAIQACSGTACTVEACNPLIGTQTFTVNPFAGLNMPIRLHTCGYTIQWDHSAFFVDFPSNFRWEMDGTTVLNSSGSTGVGVPQVTGFSSVNCFFCSRIYSTTGSITSGTKTLTVASSTNLTVGSYIIVIGALGSQSLQQTTTNGATGTGASFVVNSLSGWDNTGTKNNYLQVESEQMVCSMSGQTALTFTGCTRGINGTTAVSHANAVNVNATANLITRIAAISGNTLTLADSATTTVTSAQVYAGVSNVIIEGMGVFDGQQTVSLANRFLHGTLLTLSGNVTIGPGITYKRWDQGGVSLFASGDNWIQARHYEGNGKPPLGTGWDIALFESSSHNHVASASHSVGLDIAGAAAGDIGLFIDDRSSNTTPLDGACVGNIAELGDIGVGNGYTQGVIIQSSSKGNDVTVSNVKTAGTGTGLEINYDSDWIVNGAATNVNTTGNVIRFASVDSTGGTALTTTGFTGVGNNIFLGGQVIGGAVSLLSSSDVALYMTAGAWTSVGKFYQWQMVRSGGAFGFPDIYGDGTHKLIAGDANGVGLDGNILINKTVTSYNGVATVGNGIPALVAKADATVQAANIGSTLLYAVPANGAGMYRVDSYVVVTQAATSSSTLPATNIAWTDNDSSTATSANFTPTNAANLVVSSSANAQSVSVGSHIINAKASTNINYSTTSYASVGATPMQYAIHVKLEYLGN